MNEEICQDHFKSNRERPLKLLLTPAEAARALSVSEKTLYNLTRAGAIQCRRIGMAKRYSLTALQRFAEGEG